jgi:hypothetical protein
MRREKFIAEVRHIAWIAYQIAAGQPYNEQINEDQLKSLLDGIKFQDEHPDNTPEQNHNNWMKMKISQGWKYGFVKSFENKEHPDIKPYNELPYIEQRKDIADSIAHKLAVKLWDALE